MKNIMTLAERYGPSRTALRQQHAQPKQRKCLKCRKPFMSDGPGNHVCDKCKAGPAFQGGIIDVGTSCGGKIGVRGS